MRLGQFRDDVTSFIIGQKSINDCYDFSSPHSPDESAALSSACLFQATSHTLVWTCNGIIIITWVVRGTNIKSRPKLDLNTLTTGCFWIIVGVVVFVSVPTLIYLCPSEPLRRAAANATAIHLRFLQYLSLPPSSWSPRLRTKGVRARGSFA